jgi:hypothetical protein
MFDTIRSYFAALLLLIFIMSAFTPESGHSQAPLARPLSARSGH